MFILDTDCFSLLDFPNGVPSQRLRARLETIPADDVVTTIVTYEEQTRGWFALLARREPSPRR